MLPLNAIDAIGPAFTRTHDLLFMPFGVGRSWKLAATSYLAWCGSLYFPYPLLLLFLPFVVERGSSPARLLLILLAVVPAVLYTALFYVFVRLQLVDFEMVVTTAKMIAPMWRRYARKVWPWMGIKAVVGTVSMLLMLPPMVYAVKRMILVSSQLPQQAGQPDPQAVFRLFAAMAGIYAWVLLLFLAPKTVATLLDDFALPFFVLEDVTVVASIRRGYAVFAADPLACCGYLVMKFILALAGYMMQSVALQICMIPLVLIVALIALAGSLLLRHAGPVGAGMMVVGGVILGVATLVLIFYASMFLIGYLFLFLDSYAIYFLGGRYSLLGNLLETGPGAPFAPPPVFPSPEERRDDDDGPPMPMNPAVA